MHQDGIPGKWIPKDIAAEAEKALQVFYAGACGNCKKTMDTYFSNPVLHKEFVVVQREDLEKALDLFGQIHNDWIQRLRKAVLQ